MSDDLQYITRLMRIRCDKGTMDNYINVDRDHGVLAGGDLQPVLNANDHTKKNIIHCGKCRSDGNPERMIRKDMVISGLTISGAFLFAESLADFLEDTGIITCKCRPNTPRPWIFTNEDNILEGAPALTMKSKLACRYGGVISFVPLDEYPPEEPAQMEEEIVEETEEAPLPQEVVAEAVNSALKNAAEQIAETGAVGQEAAEKVQLALAAAAAMPPMPVPETSEGNDQKIEDFLISNHITAEADCGVTALYHTVKTLDPETEVTYEQAASWMSPYAVLNDSFGVLPTGVVNALNRMGYETHYCFSKDAEEISRAAAGADAAISLYATDEHIHYVAFHADSVREDGAPVFEFYDEKSECHCETYEAFDDSLGSFVTEWDAGEPVKRGKFGSITILVNKKGCGSDQ